MSTVKMSWGTRIALLYGGFVVLIVALVAGSMRQSFDLVSPDYYGQEIKYQEVIDAGKNQSALSAPVSLQVTASNVAINFPAEFKDKALSGTVLFYSPVHAAWDKEIAISASSNTMEIARNILPGNYYKVKLKWEADGKKYYQESEVSLK